MSIEPTMKYSVFLMGLRETRPDQVQASPDGRLLEGPSDSRGNGGPRQNIQISMLFIETFPEYRYGWAVWLEGSMVTQYTMREQALPTPRCPDPGLAFQKKIGEIDASKLEEVKQLFNNTLPPGPLTVLQHGLLRTYPPMPGRNVTAWFYEVIHSLTQLRLLQSPINLVRGSWDISLDG